MLKHQKTVNRFTISSRTIYSGKTVKDLTRHSMSFLFHVKVLEVKQNIKLFVPRIPSVTLHT